MKKYKIIYDDQDLLVVCKFAGLAVQSARVSTPDLMSLLRNEMLERGEALSWSGEPAGSACGRNRSDREK